MAVMMAVTVEAKHATYNVEISQFDGLFFCLFFSIIINYLGYVCVSLCTTTNSVQSKCFSEKYIYFT